MSIILITIVFSTLLAFAIGLGLGFFEKKFKVDRDPKINQVRAALPGANCGACGYPGCDAYAEAVAAGSAAPSLCTSGGKKTADELAAILGVTVSAEDNVVVLLCQGSRGRAHDKGDYVGIRTCQAAKLSTGSTKLCAWACLGHGDCECACPFDAIHVEADGIPHVDFDKCTGCGQCVKACPQLILALSPRAQKAALTLCSNRNTNKAAVRKTCSVGCFKCDLCVKNCPEKCISMQNQLPVVDVPRCTSCGKCVDVCPDKCFILYQNIPGRPAAPAEFPADVMEREKAAKAAEKAAAGQKETAAV
jgi:Na+-translocating ferredoxin:NAD+ oxidoreductase subunit B